MEKISVKDLNNINLKSKIICFPTDTVYGVGCMIDDLDAIKKIYDMKNRDYSKPLAVLTGNKDISEYVLNVSDKAYELMDKYWPGALTIIFKKSNKVNDLVTSSLDTVGFRMPNSKIALKVLEEFGVMATTSVNISGQSSLNDTCEIEKEFGNIIDYMIIEKEELSCNSSTVVLACGDELKVLRQGDIKL